MKKIFRMVVVLAPVIFFQCTEEEFAERDYPRVLTRPVEGITADGATFYGEVFAPYHEVTDHGFVWGDSQSPHLSASDYVSLGAWEGVGVFSATVNRSLKADTNFYVRAYARTSKYTVYGQTVAFLSLGGKAPEVVDFKPKSGTWLDTITVNGRNFSQVSGNNIVKVGEHTATVVAASDTVLKITLPLSFLNSTGEISVQVAGNIAKAADLFSLDSHTIAGFSPDSANFGTSVTIKGTGLNGSYSRVFIGETEVPVSASSSMFDELTVVLPKGLPKGFIDVSVMVGDREKKAEKKFFRASPSISSVTPTLATYGSMITIEGEFLVPVAEETLVEFKLSPESIPITVSPSEVGSTTVSFKVPNYYIGFNPSVAIISGGESTNALSLEISKPVLTSISPGSGLLPGDQITINGEHFPNAFGYEIVLNGDNDASISAESQGDGTVSFLLPLNALNSHASSLELKLLNYSAGTAEFTTPYVVLATTTSEPETAKLVIDNSVYMVGLGRNGKFKSYNIVDKTWSNLPMYGNTQLQTNSFVFSSGGEIFLGIGGGSFFVCDVCSFYRFKTSSNIWENLPALPMKGRFIQKFHSSNGIYVLWADGDGRSLTERASLWQFDAEALSWTRISDFPLAVSEFINWKTLASGTDAELLLVISGNNEDMPPALWRFNIEDENWSESSLPFNLFFPSAAFSYDSRRYFVFEEEGLTKLLEYSQSSATLVASNSLNLPSYFFENKSAAQYYQSLLLFEDGTIYKYGPSF